MSGSFVLIASYPKSGNTWMRVVLEKLRRGGEQPVSINDLDIRYQGGSRRAAFDSWAPVNAADLTFDEIEGFLPDVYRRLAAEIQDFAPVKVHDAASRNFRGEWIYPPDCVKRVIYLVRHPFDVAVSLAYHLNTSPERAVEMMADEGRRRRPYRRLSQSLPQNFASWSSNVESWMDNPAYGVSWSRYEDMHAEPVAQILRLATAAGMPVSRHDVEIAVKATDFQELQREEEVAGFREKAKVSRQFFRSGHPGTWKGLLDAALRERLVHDHGRVMRRLGYNEDGSTSAIQPSS
ncbi:MAG TPA: sulfotransferase domain-containing protein [Rhizomicrobium sp.]|jgi:hypothetical protein|nr:sulfotransferase domain-containing protein [Rhizomicrobium sp.]